MAFELLTLAVAVPTAPAIMVAVATHHLPTWCLVLAGMGVGWASDAVGILFGHCMGLYRARRAASQPPPGSRTPPDGEPPTRHDTDPQHGHPPRPDLGRPE